MALVDRVVTPSAALAVDPEKTSESARSTIAIHRVARSTHVGLRRRLTAGGAFRRGWVCWRCLKMRRRHSRDRPINDESTPLFTLVYQELRRIARRERRSAGSPHTLDTTALVHEVYLKLHGVGEAQALSRPHFLSLAARAMRQVLVDNARHRGRIKRGGFAVVTDLHEGLEDGATPLLDVVALDDALNQLASRDPRAGQLVEWHVFGGLSIEEIAELQGLTVRTVFRDWRRARAFLIGRLRTDTDGVEA
jgi:RNA polymerase sigma factor (TIGR02999 family)